MKKLFTMFIFVSLFEASAFCQFDANGKPIDTEIINQLRLKSNILPVVADTVAFKADSVRSLSELNSSTGAEAYPWISSDGLRIYYTKSISNINNIYFASRNTVHEPFSNAKALTLGNENNIFSCWLTNDELHIYFIDNVSYKVYHAQRSSKLDDFGIPSEITIDSKVIGFKSGISFTPDFKQLFLYNGTNNIIILQQNGTDNYVISDTLDIPNGSLACPGTLSQDGLTYYLGLTFSKIQKLYYYTRTSLSENFTKLYYIDNKLINIDSKNMLQPFVSGAGNYFVFVSAVDYWQTNDLYIGYLKPAATLSPIESESEHCRIFPNPAINSVSIASDNTIEKIMVYSIFGTLIDCLSVTQESNNVQLLTQNYRSGIYMVTIYTKQGNVYSEKLTITK